MLDASHIYHLQYLSLIMQSNREGMVCVAPKAKAALLFTARVNSYLWGMHLEPVKNIPSALTPLTLFRLKPQQQLEAATVEVPAAAKTPLKRHGTLPPHPRLPLHHPLLHPFRSNLHPLPCQQPSQYHRRLSWQSIKNDGIVDQVGIGL